jgi:phosphoribosyl 1,2-cyclic phosphate phosphodiesterase
MAEAVILGSGTSTGVPLIGKTYPPEYLASPKNHRLRCALLLRGAQGNVLVDAGADIRQQLLRENVMDLAGVIITHTHADHVMGMDDLRAYCISSNQPLNVYTNLEYQQDIRRIFGYAFEDFPAGIWVPRFELQEMPEILNLAGFSIRSFWVDHGPWPVMGIRIDNFAYITDVNRIPERVWPILEGLDDLVLDAVRYRPHPNHFHFDQAVEVAQRIGAKRTWLTHLSDDFDHDEVNQGLPADIQLAFDGLTISLAD